MTKYDQDRHHRRSIRLPGYDYSSPGAYFITICTHNRELLLEDGDVRQIVESVWADLPNRFPGIQLDQFIIMPNHVHFIIHIVGAPLAGALKQDQTDITGIRTRAGASPAPTTPSLGDLVGAFKSLTSVSYLRWVEQNAPQRPGQLWQRNYYEHIIRDEDELNRLRQYIIDNPANWETDEENPNRIRV